MIKLFLSSTFLIALISGILSLFLPWWILAPVAGGVAMYSKLGGKTAFLTGLAGGTLLWFSVATWIDVATAAIMTNKIAQILTVDPSTLLYITGLIGGLVAGFGALTGSYLRAIFVRKRY